VQAYLNESLLSAYRVLGNNGWAGKINIRFYQKAAAGNGTIEVANAPWAQNLVNINTVAISNWSGAQIGATIAHETSHILYNNYTRESVWAGKSQAASLYSYMLTESLARFTGDVAYAYGSRYSAATIKQQLKNYAAQTNNVYSWFRTIYNYTQLSTLSQAAVQQTLWQFQAMGYYLTGGNRTSGNPYLVKTIYALRIFGSYNGQYLASTNGGVAQTYFEYAFKYGYGCYANAAWQLGTYNNSGYLYGKFFAQWYV
jgi:hypothetical protein